MDIAPSADDYMDIALSADEQTYNYAIDIFPADQRCLTPLSDGLYEQTDLPPDSYQDLCPWPSINAQWLNIGSTGDLGPSLLQGSPKS